ncbi:hypothetical protein ETD83_07710 [Actinomadura soli]|uniref:Uncharacterized protein n=1 Tax=Actinomadura soli TaxID=2508997 RepID=A0A5C4JHR2_9ACTN|nr:hypothetical protein [Actinomadura soli]TMR04925.1 hypothetical protein ETD83_07710 [Actinomadura soli]
MRSLGPIFAASLPEVAFIRDWLGSGGLRPHIKLASAIDVEPEVGAEARRMADAWAAYESRLTAIKRHGDRS